MEPTDAVRYRYALVSMANRMGVSPLVSMAMPPYDLCDAVEEALAQRIARLEQIEANEARAIALLDELGGDDE